jgi:futalosine hydrolase
VILVCAATEGELDACLGPLGTDFRSLPASAAPAFGQGAPARARGKHLFAVTGVGIPMTLARLLPLASAAKPGLILNVGIAGAYPDSGLAIGTVVTASAECFGDIGVELPGPDPFGPVAGFPWADEVYRQPLALAADVYGDPAGLFSGASVPAFPIRMGKGCTVNRCTGKEGTGRLRRQLFNVDFESMEGAAAALAGRELGVPVCEVRAISNMASNRDMRPENIALALGNLGVYLARWLESHP